LDGLLPAFDANTKPSASGLFCRGIILVRGWLVEALQAAAAKTLVLKEDPRVKE
jgi:hypothetical protein